jgi:hypothetical protein
VPDTELYLERIGSSPWGTFGTLQHGDWRCATLEPRWKGNARSVSCIPAGTYELAMRDSPMVNRTTSGRFSRGWEVTNVPERRWIMIHPGNWERNTDGCILVGVGSGIISGEPGIGSSQQTFAKLMELLAAAERWTIHILWQSYDWP